MKAFEQVVVSSGVIGLTVGIYKHGLEKSQRANLFVAGGSIRYRTDGGAPTASVGCEAFDGDVIELTGFNEVNLFRAIKSGAVDATVAVDYS